MNEKQIDEAKKKCVHCQMEIDVGAKKCPHCQSDLRPWPRRHPVLSVLFALIVISILLHIVSGNNSNPSVPSSGVIAGQSLTAQNNPTIKELATVPADHIGQSFTLTVHAESANYYNYGFDDETKWYSIEIWDDSVDGDYEGVYAYLPKNTQTKALMDQLIKTPMVLKVLAEIPADRWQSGSNAFLLINGTQAVQ